MSDFSMSTEAADKNFNLLKEIGFDLEKRLLSDGHSPLQPGSEFQVVYLRQLNASTAEHHGT